MARKRKLKQSEAVVLDAADRWYREQMAEHEAKYGKRFNYRVYGVSPDIYGRRCRSVCVEVSTIEGDAFEGGLILFVNDETLQVEMMEGL